MTEHISAAELNRMGGVVARRRNPKCDYKREFLNQLHLAGLSAPETEVVFAPPRQWRADYLWARERVIAEYQGIFGGANASHASLQGLKRDYEKFTEASLLGFRLILITAESVRSGQAVEWVRRALND